MKHVWTSLALAAGALTLPAYAASASVAPASSLMAGEGWVADFDEAAAMARKEGKNLLVDFTGSDWCGWCIRLHKEVFDHESWSSAVHKDYILVALDFPRGEDAKALVPNPERNQELSEMYGVQGFPTILLMTPDGDVFGRTGYEAGGPEAYLAHMADLKAKGMPGLEAAQKLVTAFESAEGDARKTAFLTLAEKLETGGPGIAGERMLKRVVRAGMDADPDGTKGMRLAAVKALLAASEADAALLQAAVVMDPKNAEGLYEQAMLVELQNVDADTLEAAMANLVKFDAIGVHQDKSRGFEIYLAGAYFAAKHTGQADLSKVYARKAKAIGYTGNPQWSQMIEDLLAD